MPHKAWHKSPHFVIPWYYLCEPFAFRNAAAQQFDMPIQSRRFALPLGETPRTGRRFGTLTKGPATDPVPGRWGDTLAGQIRVAGVITRPPLRSGRESRRVAPVRRRGAPGGVGALRLGLRLRCTRSRRGRAMREEARCAGSWRVVECVAGHEIMGYYQGMICSWGGRELLRCNNV